jgi:hypothetical protein
MADTAAQSRNDEGNAKVPSSAPAHSTIELFDYGLWLSPPPFWYALAIFLDSALMNRSIL